MTEKGIDMVLKNIKKQLKNKLSRTTAIKVPLLQGAFFENGKTAIVTGGTSGIGLSIADAYCRNGCNVILTGRDQEKINKAVRFLKEKYDDRIIVGFQCDNSDVSSIKKTMEKIESDDSIPDVSIIVNNAGILSMTCFEDMTEDEYSRVLDTNLKGTYFWSQTACDYFIKKRIPGNVLMIGSSSCLRPALSPYTISKWGIRGFVQGLAKAMIPFDIVVNGLSPGPTLTPMANKEEDDYIDNKSVPAKRFALPDEVANLAIILTSSIGRMIIGDMIYITGGSGSITYDDVSYFDQNRVEEYWR